jgi:ribosome maturation factor RimP
VDAAALIRPVVERAGLELVDVTFGREHGRRVLRVIVDREGGVDLETISSVSERVSRRLDVEGFDPGAYQLEVSSPGIERPLRSPREFARAIGRQVRIRTREPIDGSRHLLGALVAADDEAIVVATSGGEHRVPLAEVSSARTVADWGAELKRSTR